MPVRPEGVYADGKGGWYFKATLGRDPLTGKQRKSQSAGSAPRLTRGERARSCSVVSAPWRVRLRRR